MFHCCNTNEIHVTSTSQHWDTIFNHEAKETEKKPGDWIPNAMKLIGSTKEEQYLNTLISNLNTRIHNSSRPQSEKDKLTWDQRKIDSLWNECLNFNNDHGVQIDPRLMIAILIKEGTGSFNTDATNLAADGQNGAELDFNDDLKKAIDLLGGKIASYAYFQEDFSNSRSAAYRKNIKGISDYDDILHYLNWKTPRLNILSKGFSSGVYAGDNNWHRGVRQLYSELAYVNVSQEYTNYAVSLGKSIVSEIAKKYSIVIKTVIFREEKNGQDSSGQSNGEHTIIGVIN